MGYSYSSTHHDSNSNMHQPSLIIGEPNEAEFETLEESNSENNNNSNNSFGDTDELTIWGESDGAVAANLMGAVDVECVPTVEDWSVVLGWCVLKQVHPSVVRALLERGANIHYQKPAATSSSSSSAHGFSPLHTAVTMRNADMVHLFCTYTTNNSSTNNNSDSAFTINSTSAKGFTPLHTAFLIKQQIWKQYTQHTMTEQTFKQQQKKNGCYRG